MADDLEKRLVAALRLVAKKIPSCYGPLTAVADELERASSEAARKPREDQQMLIDRAKQLRKDADAACDSGDKTLSGALHDQARHLEQFIREKWGIST